MCICRDKIWISVHDFCGGLTDDDDIENNRLLGALVDQESFLLKPSTKAQALAAAC
jgi:hypothetical protein